jgi:hypothetical protein
MEFGYEFGMSEKNHGDFHGVGRLQTNWMQTDFYPAVRHLSRRMSKYLKIHLSQRKHNDSPPQRSAGHTVQRSNWFLFWESHETHKFILQAKCRVTDC